MNAYAAAKEMALHYARKHLVIIKNSEFSREDKVKLIKIWLRLYNIPQILKNDITNPCPDCHRQMRADGGCTFCEKSESTSQVSTKKEEATPDEEAKAAKHAKKIAQIKKGYIGRCSQEEALEVLKTNPKFTDKDGNQVIFLYTRIYEHYNLGIGRKGNIPDPKRLEELPKAIKTAFKGDYKLIYPEGVYPEYPGHIPKGTKRVYQLRLTHQNKILLFAFHDTGIVSGWFVPKKRGL